jgi:L-iditol 2-dehydrogenase
VRTLGLADCVDARASGDVVADLRAATEGRGPDVTIDATGRPEVWETAMAAVGRGGSVVFFGGCAPGTSVRVDTRRAHYEELTLVGAFHHTPELIRQAVDALETGAVVPDGLVTHRMRLNGVHAALDLMEKGDALKVLIEP